MRLLPIVLLVAVLVYALIDCGRTPKQEMPGGLPKALWLTMIVVLVGVGPLTWIIVRAVALSDRPPAPPARPGQGPAPRPPRRPSPRPSAPDDDPAFLARLEAERRRAARERDEDGRTGDGDTSPDDGDAPGGTARGEGGRTARGEGGRRGRAGAGGQNGDRRTGSAQDEPGGTPEDRGSTRREEGLGDEPPKDEGR